jgi:two-component system sensor histidine kinase/response regulator
MAPCEHKREQVQFHGRVLIAEDVRTDQILMKSLLGKLGLEVTIAGDGREAVQKASSETFHVVFMDIQMPNMDGYQATRVLRARGIVVPVIALTGYTKEEDEARCLEAGCDDYLSKPIDRLCLVEKLSKYLPSRDSPPATGAPAESQEPRGRGESSDECSVQNAVDIATREMDARPLLDWDTLVSRGFDEVLITSIMPVCIEDNRKRLRALTLAMTAHNVENVRSYAHAIKGSFAMVGAVQLAEIARRLEEEAKRQDLSTAEQLLASMEKGFRELQALVSNPGWTKTAQGLTRPAGAAHRD